MASSEAWGGFRKGNARGGRRRGRSPGSDTSMGSSRAGGRHRYWNDPSVASLSPASPRSHGNVFLSPESSPRSRSPSPNRDDEADSYYRNSRAMSPKSFRSGSSFAFAGYSTEFQHGISDRLKAAMQTASRGHQYARSNSTTSPRSPLSKNGEKVGRGAEKNSDVQSGRRGGGAKRKPVKNKSYQKDRRHPGLVRRKTNARTNTSRGRALVPGRSSKYGPPPKTLRNLRAVAQPSESLRLSPRSQGGG